MTKRVLIGFSAAWLALCSGCSWQAGSVRKHLVLGVGVVETEREPVGKAGSAERVEATGLFLGPGPVVNGLMIGHSRRQTVEIAPDADLLMQAVSLTNGTFRVEVQPVVGPEELRVQEKEKQQ